MHLQTKKRLSYLFLIGILVFFGSFLYFSLTCGKEKTSTMLSAQTSSKIEKEYYLPCGMPVGIYLQMNGLMISGKTKLINPLGKVVSPAENILQSGDYITKINGKAVTDKSKFIQFIQKNKEKPMKLEIYRNHEKKEVTVTPIYTKDKDYKLGIWLKDDSHGIGTLTYWCNDNHFGTLGHGISDTDTQELLEIKNGLLYQAEAYSIIKGTKGNPGSISGCIDYLDRCLLGQVEKNKDTGVTGIGNETLKKYIYRSLKDIYPSDSFSDMVKKYALPLANPKEITTGKAQILSGITGKVQSYEINIVQIDADSNKSKSMVIEVTDEKLLKLTGGIIQGMSGSPIIQNEKLVGAVTHVLVNDPTKGYGIFIENMR